jgi:hypothetical protein
MAKSYATLYVDGQHVEVREYPLASLGSVLALAATDFGVTFDTATIHRILRNEIIATRDGLPVLIVVDMPMNLKEDLNYKGDTHED